MKRWAVVFVSMFDSVPMLEIVEGETWLDALGGHSAMKSEDSQEWLRSLGDDREKVLRELSDGEVLMEVLEIPEVR